MKKKKVIVDCDNTMGLPNWEVDDGLALLYLLGREDIEILGITNTFGNSTLKNVVKYTDRLLADVGRSDIPRFNGEPYQGQNKDLIVDMKAESRYEDELPPQEFPSDAARFLAEQVNTYPGEISVLALGPVGNIYDAWKLNKSFFDKVKEIVLMGGYVRDLYIGTVNSRELNLSCNPTAAYNVLRAGCPIIIFNGHICLQAPFGERDMNRIKFWPEPRKRIIENWLSAFSHRYSGDVFYLWDLLPAVYLSFPQLFDLKRVAINPTVKSLHRGMLREKTSKIPEQGDSGIEVIMPDNILDRELMMDILEKGWRKEWERESSSRVME